MKDFIRVGRGGKGARSRLRSLPLAARVVYSVFAVFTLVGLAFTAWLAEDMVGLDLARLDNYYAGKPSTALAPTPPPTDDHDGPALDLPPEADAPLASEPMPLRKLLEVTHFHLFSMPVYLLILSHLFMLSRMGERAKVAWISASTLGVAGHIGAPWIARGGAAYAAWAYGVSGALMSVGMLLMTTLSLWEMWAPSATAETAAQPD